MGKGTEKYTTKPGGEESLGSDVRCAYHDCTRAPERRCLVCKAYLCPTHGDPSRDPWGDHSSSKHWEHLEVAM